MVLLLRQSLTALAFASAALATQLDVDDKIITRDLEIRQTNTKCDPNGYTSLNGLNFTTYCGQNNPFNDAQPAFSTSTMNECLERCSRYWGNGEGCFGIVWVETNFECWIRNSTTGTANLRPQSGNHAALIKPGQMKGVSTACPATDGSIQTLSGVDGMAYTVNCGKVISGFDECFSGMPKPCLDNPYKGFFHTNSLEDCLRICVDQRPLCKAVSWNPGLEIGFANCWLKTGFPDSGLSTPGGNMGVLHSATITRIDPIDRNCPSAKTYTSSSGGNKKFDIHCGQLNSGTNITSIHTQNVTSCMDACAKSDQKCVGVVFDSALSNGFKNCYLQNSTNTISDVTIATYAALSGSGGSSSSGSGSDSSSSSSSSSSKAWIAGPVIGGIAAVAIIAFAAFWWRRRKNARANAAVEKDGNPYHGNQFEASPAYSPGGVVPGRYHDAPHYAMAPMELNAQDNASNELPGSTKYAQHKQEKQHTPHELPS